MSLLKHLGIKHPIFLAPMAGVSTPELAAEVSNQGGLGALGLGACTVSSARDQILKTQELTDQQKLRVEQMGFGQQSCWPDLYQD